MERDARAAAGLAVDADPGTVFLDDLSGDGEAEADARLLGGEVGLEDTLQVLGSDAGARVNDAHLELGCMAWMALTSRFIRQVRRAPGSASTHGAAVTRRSPARIFCWARRGSRNSSTERTAASASTRRGFSFSGRP
jgi:hypothetical protein